MITGLNLINEVEDRLSWRQTSTLEGTLRPETRKLLRLLNRVLNSLQTLDDWPLLREDGDLQLVAHESEDETDATITLDSKTVTLASAAFTDSYKTRLIKFGTDDTLYRIARVVSATEIELNRPWVGSTITNDELSYQIVQDRYVLPGDFDRPTGGWESFFGAPDIDAVGPERFLQIRRDRGNRFIYGDTDMFTVYGLDDSDTFQILHVDPYPEYARILYYTYQKNHPVIDTDEDRVLFPKSHEGIVIEAMLHLANRDYTDDAKTQAVLQDFLRSLNQAQGAGNVAQDRLSFSPSGAHRQAQYQKWGHGGKVDWGSLFDRNDKTGFF